MKKRYDIVTHGLKSAFDGNGTYTAKEDVFGIRIVTNKKGAALTIIGAGMEAPDYTIDLKDISDELKELISLGLL